MIGCWKILFIYLVFSLATAEPVQDETVPYLINSDNVRKDYGQYTFYFQTSDGTARYEEGRYSIDKKQTDVVKLVYKVHGSYRYKAPDGVIYTVSYVADENGYHPVISTYVPGQPPSGQEFAAPATEAAVPPDLLASLLGG